MYEKIVARKLQVSPEQMIRRDFKGHLDNNLAVDALFCDATMSCAIGAGNLPKKAPAVLELMKHPNIARYLSEGRTGSLLLLNDGNGVRLLEKEDNVKEIAIPKELSAKMASVLSASAGWAGTLDEEGGHVVDLRAPSPGPHFSVNLLMGNRIGFGYALQTTPKSVVDRLGRGSFRSHAAMQVLATRWDMRQEENGFPANRQFYLTENSKKIFYSAEPGAENVKAATCTHLQNRTVIRYATECSLAIERTIFVLPQAEGLPLATEVQRIRIRNTGKKTRNLRLVYTGMFGTSADHAIFEDVLYSNVIMQARVLKDAAGNIAAISPDYYPEYCQQDVRFHTVLIRNGNAVAYPTEFCANYNEFVGNGFWRKGPGFFALGCQLAIEAGKGCAVDNFTGLVSAKANLNFDETSLDREVGALIKKYAVSGAVENALESVKEFGCAFGGFLQAKSADAAFDAYFNENLPFQVRYQMFVSRSFCQTQKGYREIGFREIQDLFAGMYYFIGMGKAGLVRQLLLEWCGNVYELGFANHNFYWTGKEPGKWSDDALWFIQAAHRYISATGDIGFLDEKCAIAGTSPICERPVFETIQAILRYSGEISVGKHGLPLLDRADWNDCLTLDTDFVDGPQKEKLYRKQIEEGGTFGEPLRSDYSESVMNAFLLKLALDMAADLAKRKGDSAVSTKLADQSGKLAENLQKHAWKGDFFARVLLNRYKDGKYTYLGAGGDGLSADPGIGGTYFINSYSWSILSGCATEEQIRISTDSLEAYLKTPYGFKLMSPASLDKLATGTATGHYFPGDRENGAVFKHASMMAVSAMLKASKEVKDKVLAARLASLAYWMIDLALPYKTMASPFETCGNPRFCTQYNNSETGEGIGPMLSGTATWLDQALMSAFGVEFTGAGIALNPVLREEQESLNLSVRLEKSAYSIGIRKPAGFRRFADGGATVTLDGKVLEGNVLPVFTDGATHAIEIAFK
jgi:cellobiose phosphorylase